MQKHMIITVSLEQKIFLNFDDDVIAYHNGKRYGEKIAFRSKEACQKYCDWLNKENK